LHSCHAGVIDSKEKVSHSLKFKKSATFHSTKRKRKIKGSGEEFQI
jgi:hypothetical protein